CGAPAGYAAGRSDGQAATGALARRTAAAHRTWSGVEGLAEAPAQGCGRLAAGPRPGGEGALRTASGVPGEAGYEEGQDGQERAYGDDGDNYHDRLPSLVNGLQVPRPAAPM